MVAYRIKKMCRFNQQSLNVRVQYLFRGKTGLLIVKIHPSSLSSFLSSFHLFIVLFYFIFSQTEFHINKKVCVCVHLAAQSFPTLWDPLVYSSPGSPVYEFIFGQQYWSGVPFPTPGDFSNPGIETGSAALQILYLLSHQGIREQ